MSELNETRTSGGWWRTVALGAAALLGVAFVTTLAFGWASGAGLPTRVPVFVVVAILLAPLAPWLTIGKSSFGHVADRDPLAVEDRRRVMGVHRLEDERQDRRLAWGGADQAYAGQR